MIQKPWFHKKAWFLRKAWINPATLFTRQEIAERTGISDDVLSFWTKRGLLVSAEGGAGKGSHRRFTYPQIHIAIVCAIFRDHFGANIATLSSLAQFLQRATRIFENAPIYMGDWELAARIGQALAKFRAGDTFLVEANDISDPGYDELGWEEKRRLRPATSEAEVIADVMRHGPDESSPAAIIKFAETLGVGHVEEARVAQVLLGLLLSPAYMDEPAWLLRQTGDGWDVREATDGWNFSCADPSAFGPALFVPIGSMLKSMWDIPKLSELRRIMQARELEARLANQSVGARVTPQVDGDGFTIEASRSQAFIIRRVLKQEGLQVPAEWEGE